MADFDQAIGAVLEHEDAGLTGRVTLDSGGLTRWGISARAYPQVDIARLSLEDAKALYRRDYWEPLSLGAIEDQHVAGKVLDMAVNMGDGTAAKLLQRAVGVAQDGKIGPVTLAAVNAADPQAVLADLRHLSAERYRAIAARAPHEYSQYLKGWLRRAEA